MALTHFFGRPQNILMACNDDQRERYLLPAVRGEKMDALAMTEPDAGSDVRGMKCTAVRDGGDWVVNGSKHFISGAEHADFFIVFIATGVDETPRGQRNGSPTFLVDRGTPGFEVREGYNSVSHKGLQELHPVFRQLPPARCAGAGRGRWRFCGDERMALCHPPDGCRDFSVGRARRCFDYALNYAAERKQFGQPIGKFQGVGFPDRRHDHRNRCRGLANAVRAWRLDQGPAREPRNRLGQALCVRDAGAGHRHHVCRSSAGWG